MDTNSTTSSQSEDLLQNEQHQSQTPQYDREQKTKLFKECDMVIEALGQLHQNRIQKAQEAVKHQSRSEGIESIPLADQDIQLVEHQNHPLNQAIQNFNRLKKHIQDVISRPRTDH